MECPNCQAELDEKVKYCSDCGYNLGSEEQIRSRSHNPKFSPEKNLPGREAAEGALKPPSGFRRTLSTELVVRQTELRTLIKLNALIERRTYKPGEILIHKGETNRDLIFLTEGLLEISKEEKNGNLVLNEAKSPYILGDIGFLSGLSRTATAKAKTEAKTFVLKYEDLKSLFRNFPEWLHPLLTSFVSGIKSLHYKAQELERKVLELEGKMRGQTPTID